MQHSFVRAAVYAVRSAAFGSAVVAFVALATGQPASALGLGSNDLSVPNPVAQQISNVPDLVAPVTNSVTQSVTNVLTPVATPAVSPPANSSTNAGDALKNVTAPVTTVATPTVNNVGDVINQTITPVTSIGNALTLSAPPTSSAAAGLPQNSAPIVSVTGVLTTNVGQVLTATAGAAPAFDSAVVASRANVSKGVAPPMEQLPATFSRAVVVIRPRTPARLSRVYFHDLTPGDVLRSAIKNAATYSFPIGMMFALVGFVLLNGRLDRNEAKLRQSPARRSNRRDAVSFS